MSNNAVAGAVPPRCPALFIRSIQVVLHMFYYAMNRIDTIEHVHYFVSLNFLELE